MGEHPVPLSPIIHGILMEAVEQGLPVLYACALADVALWAQQGNTRPTHPVPVFASFAHNLTQARMRYVEKSREAEQESVLAAPHRTRGLPPVIAMCLSCHTQFMIPRYRLQPSGNYCSPECSHAGHRRAVEMICDGCGSVFHRAPAKKSPLKNYCSRSCVSISQSRTVDVVCDGCGILFQRKSYRLGAKNYCTFACYHLSTRRHVNIQAGKSARVARRRIRMAEASYVEDVDVEYLYQRDRGTCQLCLTHCHRADASCDHIIPLSQGGEHSYRNCVLAHLRCNSAKGARPWPQNLRLFG